MPDQDIHQIVKETIDELKRDGTIHVTCPWDGIEHETIDAIKTLPHGAVRMVAATWGVFSRFGQMAGHAIAVGAFLVVVALFCLGGLAIFKLGSFVMGLVGE
jgi:sensor domain CHASE-containing protein